MEGNPAQEREESIFAQLDTSTPLGGFLNRWGPQPTEIIDREVLNMNGLSVNHLHSVRDPDQAARIMNAMQDLLEMPKGLARKKKAEAIADMIAE